MCRARPVVAISSIETAGGGADRRRRDSGQTAVRELDPPVDVGGTVPAGRFLLLAPRPASQRERRGVWNLQGQAPPRGRRRRHSWSAQVRARFSRRFVPVSVVSAADAAADILRSTN